MQVPVQPQWNFLSRLVIDRCPTLRESPESRQGFGQEDLPAADQQVMAVTAAWPESIVYTRTDRSSEAASLFTPAGCIVDIFHG